MRGSVRQQPAAAEPINSCSSSKQTSRQSQQQQQHLETAATAHGSST